MHEIGKLLSEQRDGPEPLIDPRTRYALSTCNDARCFFGTLETPVLGRLLCTLRKPQNDANRPNDGLGSRRSSHDLGSRRYFQGLGVADSTNHPPQTFGEQAFGVCLPSPLSSPAVVNPL